MKLLSQIEKTKIFWTIFVLCLLFFLLRFPSLFEPNWYGDEGIYQTIGYGLRSGRQFYTEVWDNKPPLLFIIYAVTNGDQFTARLLSLFFGFGAVIAFYSLTKKLFKQRISQLMAAVFFVLLFGLPTIEGNIANSENFMLFPIIAAVNIVYPLFNGRISVFDNKKKLQIFAGGLVLSSSFLIKIVSIFDLFALIAFSFIAVNIANQKLLTRIFSGLKTVIPRLSWFIAGFILPVLLSVLIFYALGVLPQYTDAAFGRNVGYVGWANHFIIPQGLLYIRMALLVVFLVLVFLNKKLFANRSLFIIIWFSFSLFNAFFSNRPYTHYLLLLLPAASLFFGLLFTPQNLHIRMFKLLTAVLLFIVVVMHFEYWGFDRTAGYYANFGQFITGKKNFFDYQSFFDTRNPKDYAIAAYLKRHTDPKDTVLLWGNSAQIYPLSETLPVGRYSTAYHIGTNRMTVSETETALKKMKPKYIIITPDEQTIPFNLAGYSYVITIEDAHIYERSF